MQFTPSVKEYLHSAEVLKKTIQFLLHVFGKFKRSVVAVIGGNYAKNRLIASLLFGGFVRCAGRQYIQAATVYINKSQNLLVVFGK